MNHNLPTRTVRGPLLPLLLLAGCCLLLVACGQKGPLFMPEDEPVTVEPVELEQAL